MTFVTYPKMPLSQVWRVPIAAAVAVIDALSTLGIEARLKWPNDIFLDGCKLGGILVETVTLESHFAALVGIGINVRQTRFEGQEKFVVAPTSLALASGDQCPSVGAVIDAVSGVLAQRIQEAEEGWPGLYETWQIVWSSGWSNRASTQ